MKDIAKDLSTFEKIGIGAGMLAPLVAIIWAGAVAWEDIKVTQNNIEEVSQEIEVIHKHYDDLRLSQNRDELINRDVDVLAETVEWLKYHHHHDNGEGRPHVD